MTATARRAALALYAMTPADRTQALAALGEAQCARLAPLLAELESMGIAPDPSLLTELLGPATPEMGAEVADDAAPGGSELVYVDELAPRLVALLMRARGDAFTQAVMERAGRLRHDALQDARDALADRAAVTGPAVAHALSRAFDAHIRSGQGTADAGRDGGRPSGGSDGNARARSARQRLAAAVERLRTLRIRGQAWLATVVARHRAALVARSADDAIGVRTTRDIEHTLGA